MTDTYDEREDKYDVPTDYEVPDLAGIGGGTVERSTVQLRTTYWDTADHTLLACRVTLRRRDGDTDTGWQLKVPGAKARTEIRVPLGDEDGVPARLTELVTGLSGGTPLQPIAELRTERRLHRLQIHDVTAVDVADDLVEATVEGRVTRWREVEAELGGGTEKQLRKVGSRLRDAGAVPATSASKLARAIGAAEPMAPAVGLVRAYLREQLVAIARGDIDLRRGLDPIHKTRVAVRRCRSVLRAFGPAFDAPDELTALDAELSWYQDLLGEVRDREVLRTHFATAVAALAPELVLGRAAVELEQTLLSEQARAREEVSVALDSDRYRSLVRTVASWARHPLLRKGIDERDLVQLADKAHRKARRRLKAALASQDPVQLHRARKSYKRSRYAAELVAPVAGSGARRTVRRGKRLQDALGEYQDSVVAADVLRRLATSGGEAAAGFTYGMLWQREQERGDRARADLAELR